MMTTNCRHFLGIAIALCASAIAPAAFAQGTTKIGFHAGLTGPAAADGNSGLAAAKLAVEQINGSGGVNGKKLELVVFDDQGKPEQAVPVANKMVGDGVRAVVSTGFSGPSRAAAPVFQKARIPYIAAIAFAPEITRTGNYMFRATSMGEVQGRAAAKLIGGTLHKKRAVLLTIKTDFGKTLASGFKEASAKYGIELLKEYEYSPGDRQFGPLIASLKADNPDVIYATGFYFTVGPLVAQLRSAGVSADVVGAESLSSQQYIDIAGQAAEGTVITNVIDWGSQLPEIAGFLSAYEKATGTKAEAASASTHAAITVLAAAMRKAKSDDPGKIRDALETVEVTTAIGRVSFNKLHEVKKSFPLSIVRGGKWQRFGVIDDPVLLAPPEQ
ncbi:ABC transporter substrate-binding protein [Variovorax terrae]|uniref:ABC transporter substrate-binding protein n=1 Tax=Variovorax terrae TaxID=2923278 RepID=A0A9X1W1L5_9BURK|nr:ABC transporter substrate-binding protein [Variovorax terrae]MCJ0766139.1 ABC transporter substrate-binding protein [Variovorax terrae]